MLAICAVLRVASLRAVVRSGAAELREIANQVGQSTGPPTLTSDRSEKEALPEEIVPRRMVGREQLLSARGANGNLEAFHELKGSVEVVRRLFLESWQQGKYDGFLRRAERAWVEIEEMSLQEVEEGRPYREGGKGQRRRQAREIQRQIA